MRLYRVCEPDGYKKFLIHRNTRIPGAGSGERDLSTPGTQQITTPPHTYQHLISQNAECPTMIGHSLGTAGDDESTEAEFEFRFQLQHEVLLFWIGGHAVFDGLIRMDHRAVISPSEMNSDCLER